MNKNETDEIVRAIRNHPAGEALWNEERWGKMRAGESRAVWRQVLGATANVLEHMEMFGNLAGVFMRSERGRFTPEQCRIFRLGAVCHDLGEARINGVGVGDVAAFLKTSEDERKEVDIAHLLIEKLELNDSLKETLHKGYRLVVEGEDRQLHCAFKALERTEYVMTAVKVYDNCRRRERLGLEGLIREKQLVGEVLVNDLVFVLDNYASNFPNSIGIYVRKIAPTVREALGFTQEYLESVGQGVKVAGALEKLEDFLERSIER